VSLLRGEVSELGGLDITIRRRLIRSQNLIGTTVIICICYIGLLGPREFWGALKGERLTRWLDLAYHESERFSNETQAWERPAVSRVSR